MNLLNISQYYAQIAMVINALLSNKYVVHGTRMYPLKLDSMNTFTLTWVRGHYIKCKA